MTLAHFFLMQAGFLCCTVARCCAGHRVCAAVFQLSVVLSQGFMTMARIASKRMRHGENSVKSQASSCQVKGRQGDFRSPLAKPEGFAE